MKSLFVAAMALAMAGAAWSDVRVSTTLGPATITLTDLDLNDGIQPAFGPVSGVMFSDLSVQSNGHEQEFATAFYPAFIASSDHFQQGPVTVSTTVDTAGTLEGLTASSTGVWQLKPGPSVSFMYAVVEGWLQFKLSPRTRVELSLNAIASITGALPAGDHMPYASSSATLQLMPPDSPVLPDSFDSLALDASGLTSPFINMREERILTVSFANLSTDVADIDLRLRISSNGHYVSSVPEPGLAALWLCGVMLLAGAGKVGAGRRKQAAV